MNDTDTDYVGEPPFLGELSQSQIGVYGFAQRMLLVDGRGTDEVVAYLVRNWSFDPRDARTLCEWALRQTAVWKARKAKAGGR